MRHRAAKLFSRDFLAGNGLNNRRAGDEHLAGVLNHVNKVGDRRGINRTASARPHDRRDLRHNTRSRRIPEEDTAVTGESVNRFLDTGSAGIVQANARRAHAHGQILYLPDLVRVLLTKGAALYRKVLRERIDKTAVNRAVTTDDAFARQLFLLLAEVRAAMMNQRVQLDKRTFVKEDVESLASSHFAFLMLLFDALLSSAETDVFELFFHQFNFFLNSSHALPPNKSKLYFKCLNQFLFCTKN